MNEQIHDISLRLKAMREITNCSIDEISKKLKIAPGVYESYESGNEDIPMGFLLDFANLCKIELSDLLSGGSPMLHTYSFIKKDRGTSIERREHYKYQHLAYNFANKKAEPFMVTVESNENDTVSLNSHDGQEFNYCVEGKLMILIDGNEVILEPGDSLYFNSITSHGMKALDGKPAKFLAIIVR